MLKISMCGVRLSERHRRAQEAVRSGREEDGGRDDAAFRMMLPVQPVTALPET